MSNKMQIVFNGFVDRTFVENAIADGGELWIDVFNNFNEEQTQTFNLGELNPTELEGFLSFLDYATMTFQGNAVIWIIETTAKNFDLSQSYVRVDTTTERPLTPVDAATPLKVRFDVPGFAANNFREITLWYAEDFDPDDLLLLEEIGITLTGNGTSFSIENIIDCKVSFSRPEVIEIPYIINFDKSNEIITR